MAQRMIIFDAASLLTLMKHYAEGAIPLDGEVREVKVSSMLQRLIALVVESDAWEDTTTGNVGYGTQAPFMFRYEGKRVLKWSDKHDELRWGEAGAVEAPR